MYLSGVAGDGKRESCREEATVIFPKLLLIGEMSSSGRKHIPLLQLNLYSVQTGWIYLCKAGRQALDLKVKRGMRKGPAHLLPFLPLQLVCLVYSKAEPLHVPLTFFLIHFCVARIREGPRCLHVRLWWLQPVCPLTFKPEGRSGLGRLPLGLDCARGWL